MPDAKETERPSAPAPATVPSAVLTRLIEEVAAGVEINAAAYNRSYNRHNR